MNQRPRVLSLLIHSSLVLIAASAASLAGPPKETAGDDAQDADSAAAATEEAADAEAAKWKPLADSWQVCRFGGEGPVKIEDGLITLGYGDPMTGVRWGGEFPREGYELRLEARRTEGFDFFCGTTFPVGEKGKCSLILGGWGGGVVGLSSIDGQDAANNATTQFKTFDNDRWYKIRIRVGPEKIRCWIDGNLWVDQPRGDREFDIRYEMDPTVPMGFANYQCRSEIRKIEFRRLPQKKSGEAGEEEAGEDAAADSDGAAERSETKAS